MLGIVGWRRMASGVSRNLALPRYETGKEEIRQAHLRTTMSQINLTKNLLWQIYCDKVKQYFFLSTVRLIYGNQVKSTSSVMYWNESLHINKFEKEYWLLMTGWPKTRLALIYSLAWYLPTYASITDLRLTANDMWTNTLYSLLDSVCYLSPNKENNKSVRYKQKHTYINTYLSHKVFSLWTENFFYC